MIHFSQISILFLCYQLESDKEVQWLLEAVCKDDCLNAQKTVLQPVILHIVYQILCTT